MRPLDLAADGGVFENEPTVRTDVVRSDEFEPDVISVGQTRSARALWARKELEPSDYKPSAREVQQTQPSLAYAWIFYGCPSRYRLVLKQTIYNK